MYLQALATATPPAAYTQPECWEILARSSIGRRLHERSMNVMRNILCGEHGIGKRHFAMPNIETVFDLTPDQLNAGFRAEGPKLAARALAAALEKACIRPAKLDALLICTCTGYLCPGLTSYVAEQMGLRSNAILHDIVGLGCGAAIPMLRAASQVLAAQPGATVACVAVEICSAAFYLDDDPGVLVSACLFSDGAAATVWRSESGPDGLRCFDFQSLHWPLERDKLRFEMRHGKLRNLLHRTVPAVAAAAAAELWRTRGDRPVAGVATHVGGRDVIDALETVLPDHPLDASRRILRDCGNMSSPSVLFVLEEKLKAFDPPTGDLWLASFGAGFSAHSCRIGKYEG